MAFGALGRIDFRLQFHIDWRDPRIAQVFVLMLPVTIGLGIVNLDQLINSAFGTLVNKEAPRAIDNAFRIYMLPQGLFSVAVATVLFPTLSRMAANRDVQPMRRALGIGMRQINLLLIPSAAFLMVLTDADRAARLPARPVQRRVHAPRLDRAVLVRRQPAVRRPEPAADAGVLRGAAAVDPDPPGGGEHRRRHRRLVALYKPLGIAGLIIGTLAANIVMTWLQLHAPAGRLQRPPRGRADDDDHRAHHGRRGAARRRLVGGLDACSTRCSGPR